MSKVKTVWRITEPDNKHEPKMFSKKELKDYVMDKYGAKIGTGGSAYFSLEEDNGGIRMAWCAAKILVKSN
jgi:hypothetical protein